MSQSIIENSFFFCIFMSEECDSAFNLRSGLFLTINITDVRYVKSMLLVAIAISRSTYWYSMYNKMKIRDN